MDVHEPFAIDVVESSFGFDDFESEWDSTSAGQSKAFYESIPSYVSIGSGRRKGRATSLQTGLEDPRLRFDVANKRPELDDLFG